MRGRRFRSSTAYKKFNPIGHPCWRQGPGCTRWATTRDHQPPLALHEHVEGSGCCQILPACAVCNARDGQRVTRAINKARAAAIARGKYTRHGAFVRRPSINGG